jgi:hypothetical protein
MQKPAKSTTFSLTRGGSPYRLSVYSAVTVVQLVERQIVVLVVVGSIPIGHPIFKFSFDLRKK